MTKLKPTLRTKLKRILDRGRFDRKTINQILDAGLFCHVAFVIDGKPNIVPTLYWREKNHVYFHGSFLSRFLKASQYGQVCFCVSLLDALVLAKSAFHHSANYRSVILYGQPFEVDKQEKEKKLKVFMDQLFKGRWSKLRKIKRQELDITTVLALKIEEGSAKIRQGPPKDDPEDEAWPIWAGLVSFETQALLPSGAPNLLKGAFFKKRI